MKQQTTFEGWDFVGEDTNGTNDIWKIVDGFDYPRLWWEPYPMEVSLKWTPQKLSCHSQGNWVKAHITLPEGFFVEDVDADAPIIMTTYHLEPVHTKVFVNDEHFVQIDVVFDRQEFCGVVEDFTQQLTVVGYLADGNIFYGTDVVRIAAGDENWDG